MDMHFLQACRHREPYRVCCQDDGFGKLTLFHPFFLLAPPYSFFASPTSPPPSPSAPPQKRPSHLMLRSWGKDVGEWRANGLPAFCCLTPVQRTAPLGRNVRRQAGSLCPSLPPNLARVFPEDKTEVKTVGK